jgi:hypothetical protein
MNDDGRAVLFVFKQENEIAIYPFLENEVVTGTCPRGYFDIQSAYGYSGPLSSTDNRSFLTNFENAFLQYAAAHNYIAEFIRFHPLLENQNIFIDHINVVDNRSTVWIDLAPSLDEIFMHGISTRCRRDVRSGQRKGLYSKTTNKFVNFLPLYINTMTAVGADEYYIFSGKYFENLMELPHTTVIDVLKDNVPIASGVFIKHGNYFHYHLSGHNRSYAQYTPTTFMLWEAIKLAKSSGCKTFLLGGGRSADNADSLLQFKSQFSRDSAAFYIGKRVLNKKIYDTLISSWEAQHNKEAKILLEYRTK